MHEIWLKVFSYLRGIWRFRWYAVLVAWIIVIAGWPFVLQMPDQYNSSARIHVDTDSLLRPLLRGLTIEPNVHQRLRIMTQTLFSRPNLEKVARMTDLDLSAQTPQQMESLLSELESKLRLNADRHSSNLYTIAYEDSDPQLAKNVVQAVVTLFVENALGETRRDRDSAHQFLEQRIAEYESRIRATEAKLMEMKRKYKGSMPGDLSDYFKQLELTQRKLKAARIELDATKKRRDELARQIQGNAASEQSTAIGPVSHFDNRIQALEKKLDDLLLKYTERHPEVVTTKELISYLRQQKQDLAEVSGSEKGLSETSPLYPQLAMALATVEGDVVSQESRVAALENEVNRLHELIDSMPEVALELSELNRAYALDKKNHQALLARMETAEMAEKVEQSADNIKFRVIEPPKVPLQPSGPNRLQLLTLVLLVALGTGAGVAFLLSQLRPTVATRQDLQDLTELPVLGSVSVVWGRGALLRRRLNLAALLLSFGLLIIAYGLVLTINHIDVKAFNWMGV